MPRAIRIHETGGPEVLRFEEIPLGDPGPGEVVLRQTAIGLNFIDTYHRTGLYPLELPAILGREAVGVIEAVGDGVDGWQVGQRAAYVLAPGGSYVEARRIAADQLIALPEAIDDRQVAALLLKGLTAEFLLHRTRPLTAGETILVHAAAGGVGSLLCPWAKALGARVIGTVGNEAKAELARAAGCDVVLLTDRDDWVARVREETDGAGVPVVYDSVGQATFDRSLDCLQPRGLMVSFGQSSGAIPPFTIGTLAAKGSLFLTRPSLFHYIADRDERDAAAARVLDAALAGVLHARIGQTYPLADAARAHADLETRRTTGSTVLIP